MSLGIIGKKIGMTRVFTAEGESQPVTVVEATPNRITQIKTADSDGYDAVQVTTGSRRQSRVTKAMQGHFAKAKSEAGRGVWEFRLDAPFAIEEVVNHQAEETESAGADESDNENENENETKAETETKPETKAKPPAENELTVTMFAQGQKVDVTGRSIGKGFSGVIKRFGFRGGRATHGNSKAHRSGGSIGNAQDPGRVFKGKKMAGQMGGRRRVQQGLEIIRVDAERNLLLISGSIPGSKGSDVIVCPSVKSKKS